MEQYRDEIPQNIRNKKRTYTLTKLLPINMAIEIATKKKEITRNNKEDRYNDFGHDFTNQISEP